MKTILFFSLLLSSQVFAKVECTTEPKAKWQNAETFKKNLEAEYKIKVFKETAGNCYEVYGHNKAGKKVEIYFNPVTGAVVKQNIEK